MRKIILFSLLTMFALQGTFAQSKKPVSIIAMGYSLKKFHEKSELDAMKKGELITLYKERIQVLINTLPFIALATKSGVTLDDVGVPTTDENMKTLLTQQENTKQFLNQTIEFQTAMMSYSDKINIVNSVIYYENMLRALSQIGE